MHDVFVIGEYVDRSMLWYGTSHHTPTIQYQYHRYHTILHHNINSLVSVCLTHCQEVLGIW